MDISLCRRRAVISAVPSSSNIVVAGPRRRRCVFGTTSRINDHVRRDTMRRVQEFRRFAWTVNKCVVNVRGAIMRRYLSCARARGAPICRNFIMSAGEMSSPITRLRARLLYGIIIRVIFAEHKNSVCTMPTRWYPPMLTRCALISGSAYGSRTCVKLRLCHYDLLVRGQTSRWDTRACTLRRYRWPFLVSFAGSSLCGIEIYH